MRAPTRCHRSRGVGGNSLPRFWLNLRRQQVDWVPYALVADQAVEDRQHGHGCAADQSTANTSRVRVNFQRQPRAMIQFADLKMPHLAAWDRENQFFLLQGR